MFSNIFVINSVKYSVTLSNDDPISAISKLISLFFVLCSSADSDIIGTSGPESPPIINRSQSFPDKQLLRRYHPSLQQPPGASADSVASGSESASAAAAGERRSWSANNALPPLARGLANGSGSPRPQLRPHLSVKPPPDDGNSAGIIAVLRWTFFPFQFRCRVGVP